MLKDEADSGSTMSRWSKRPEDQVGGERGVGESFGESHGGPREGRWKFSRKNDQEFNSGVCKFDHGLAHSGDLSLTFLSFPKNTFSISCLEISPKVPV